jgi:hypothetical protein
MIFARIILLVVVGLLLTCTWEPDVRTKHVYYYEGRVISSDGPPVPNARVIMMSAGGLLFDTDTLGRDSGLTNSGGMFTILSSIDLPVDMNATELIGDISAVDSFPVMIRCEGFETLVDTILNSAISFAPGRVRDTLYFPDILMTPAAFVP